MKKFIPVLFGLLLLTALNANATPTLDQASIDIFNADFQKLFTKLEPQLQQSIKNNVGDALASWPGTTTSISANERVTATIGSWGTPQVSGFGTAPGITLRNDGGITLRVPSTGSWGISVPNMLLRLKLEHCVRYLPWKCKWVTVGNTYHYITLDISNLTAQTGMRLIGEDSGKINIDNIENSVVSYSAVLSGPTFPGSDTLFALFNPAGSAFGIKIKGIIFGPNGTVSSIVPNEVIEGLDKLATRDLTPVGGAFRYTYKPFALDLEQTISNIDDKIINVNMPHGLVYEIISDTPVNDSWMQAFMPGGNGSPGNHTSSHATADSAIWTGHYLAALAYRYKVKQDSKSLAYVDKALKGIEILFAANGNTGLLARFAAPLKSVVGQQINADPPNDQGYGHLERGVARKIFLLKDDQGFDVEWISHQGTNGISRDQYTGVMLGLRTAYDLVDDQNIKDRIKYLTTIALDYIIGNEWVIWEDRNLATGGTPTAWVTVPYQKIAMLTIGNHITDGRYQQQLNDTSGLLNMAWFPTSFSTLDPLAGYYKYNLFYANMFSYFAIEKDQARRDKMMEAVKIMDYYAGHHNNAWFNLIRASYDPSNKDELLEQANVFLRYRLQGGHRHLPPDNIQQLITNKNIAYEDVQFPLEDTPRSIPTAPLYPALRINGEFVWQRDPYELVTFSSNSDKIESIGGDISLVYWMLKAEGYDVGYANMKTPVSNSTLTTSSVTFQWSASRHLTGTALYVGTTPGGADIFGTEVYSDQQVVSGIPLTGDPIYVRLWSWDSNNGTHVDYVYQTDSVTQTPFLSEITSPAPGSTITTADVTFNWNKGQDVTSHWLDVGTMGPGSSNIHSASAGALAYADVSGIPLGGGTLYVRLWSWKSGSWHFKDYTFPVQ